MLSLSQAYCCDPPVPGVGPAGCGAGEAGLQRLRLGYLQLQIGRARRRIFAGFSLRLRGGGVAAGGNSRSGGLGRSGPDSAAEAAAPAEEAASTHASAHAAHHSAAHVAHSAHSAAHRAAEHHPSAHVSAHSRRQTVVRRNRILVQHAAAGVQPYFRSLLGCLARGDDQRLVPNHVSQSEVSQHPSQGLAGGHVPQSGRHGSRHVDGSFVEGCACPRAPYRPAVSASTSRTSRSGSSWKSTRIGRWSFARIRARAAASQSI